MPFGIIDCKKMEQVPGTSFMSDQEDLPPEYAEVPRELLKHGKGRFANVILVPQPSDSPNDPLNWPQWKKELILLIVGLSAAVVGAFGPMLSPGFVEISAQLNITVEILSQATAWLILTIGLGLFLTNPLAKIYGKRPIYILAICIMFACSVWGAKADTYNSFLASRVISGIGMAPYEVSKRPLARVVSVLTVVGSCSVHHWRPLLRPRAGYPNRSLESLPAHGYRRRGPGFRIYH